MEIVIKLILIMHIGSCSAEVYNWNVRALENNADSDTDFGNELKLQSALSNELQRDLLKISGKANENFSKNTDNTNLRKLYNDLNKDPMEEHVKQKDDKSKSYGMKEQKLFDDYSVNLGISNVKMPNFKTNTKFSDDNDIQFVQIQQNKEQLNRGNEQNVNIDYRNYQGANDANELKYNNRQTSERNIKTANSGHRNDQFPKYTYSNPAIDGKRTYMPVHQNTFTSYDDDSQTKYEHNKANIKKYEQFNGNERQQNNEQNQTINEESHEGYQLPRHCPAEGSADIRNFLGSNLFEHTVRKCFTGNDLILLTIRKDFENLMPKDLPQSLLNDSMVAVLMNYFYVCHRLISTLAGGETKMLVLRSFFDALGGYLNYYLVPVAKYSYYAGQLSLEITYNILRLHRQCKHYLNTNGNGWRAPMRDVLNELNDISIEPLYFDANQNNNEPSYCMRLYMDIEHSRPEDNGQMIVSLPKLEVTDDSTDQLGNIWLPFRRKRVYDLKSEASAYIVVKFYETVSKCYLYENVNQDCYDRKFKEWLLENIHTHLSDDIFYPGLGAVLRVSEFLRRGRTKARNYNNLWQTNYDPGASRQKKNYQRNVKQDILMPQKIKRKQKSWDTDENFFQDNKQYQNSLKGDTEKYKTVDETGNLNRKHRQYISSDQLKLAAAVIEEQSKAANHTTTQFTVLEMTPIQWLFIIIPLAVVIVISVICCLKHRKKRRKSQVSLREPGGGKRKGTKSEEEIHLLNANSKSVVHGKYSTSKSNRFKPPPHMRSVSSSASGSTGSSSSCLMCQLPAKCCAFKRAGPAIIETSQDYSSSDAEDKAIKKAHMKAVKIDEKSGKNKGKETATASNNGVAENGKEKKSQEIPKK